MPRRHVTTEGFSRWLVRITNGRSDQGGCFATHIARGSMSFPNRPSSARNTAPAPALISETSSGRPRQFIASSFRLRKSSTDAGPSRPIGANTRTQSSRLTPILALRHFRAAIVRIAGKYAAELLQRGANRDAGTAQAKFANSMLVIAATFLYD